MLGCVSSRPKETENGLCREKTGHCGRARVRNLHPFSAAELGAAFDLDRALNQGLLPGIWFSDDPEEDLSSYVSLYLEQEILQEGATRNLPAFSRFLEVAALSSGGQINYQSIASDAQVATGFGPAVFSRTRLVEGFGPLRV